MNYLTQYAFITLVVVLMGSLTIDYISTLTLSAADSIVLELNQ